MALFDYALGKFCTSTLEKFGHTKICTCFFFLKSNGTKWF